MDELVQLVSQKTGIPQDKAREAVQIVLEHLKGRLPGPIASHIDSALSGKSSGGGELGNLLGKVG